MRNAAYISLYQRPVPPVRTVVDTDRRRHALRTRTHAVDSKVDDRSKQRNSGFAAELDRAIARSRTV